MITEVVDVPKGAFLGLVEAFLSGNYRLYLTVEEMAEKKTFSCKEKGCGAPFDVYPPDDAHTIALLEQREGSIERTYTCPNNHENTIYWAESGRRGIVVSSGR